MGVPKFFRYMSERYPCLSEYVKEYQIPEFDNLYLDMNGIIHMCSHPDDNNPHFRITEERIFADIFHYIEVLFRMIKPQKVFFMAVDGVAPRAKMNQQRGRRFRSAKDAEKMEAEAKKKGEVLPQEARFDSNCITPGTPFMAKLQEQLKYFVVNKISSDKMWRKCKVILSGHETPGEGEHKIMDYIRFIRSQPGYDPNTRHCLYGLDADLIMLGLCSHDPHFSLLREEVKFGKKSTKRNSVPEDITFFLLHLSLMREYLELEFAPLKTRLTNFAFDIEKVIDDWVLMGFLVGNDFIPHLPNLHIANGALPVLYAAYMDILPTLDGYINEGGFLNLQRFEKFMNKLGSIDVDNFEEVRDDLLYMEGKTGRKCEPFAKVNTKPRNLEEWSPDEPDSNPLFKESLEGNKKANPELEELIRQTEEMYLDSDDDEEEESDEDAFNSYKKSYYMNKMDYKNVTQDVLRDQAEGYVRAIQWNLHYYYNGVCSWSWYYPHHYSPYISDIKGFKDLKLEFQLGKPFKPYEQLLAVLPAASKNLLPGVYHDLMLGDDSPIKQFYPEEFDTDLNGKKQDWEAVVLVPFIDEKLLLQSMKTPNQMLTPEEVIRNKHGPMLEYQYTEENQGKYEAPAYFPDVNANFAKLTKLTIDDIRVPVKDLVKGAYPGVLMNVFYPGFPTMKHLTYTGSLKKAKVKVFEQPSRNESMIISLTKTEKYNKEKLPVELLGKTVYVGWPHLVEAKVVAVLNEKDRFISMGDQGQYNVEPTGNTWKQEVNGVTEYYKVRMGIDTGPTDILVKVKIMIGRRYCFAPNGRINLEKNFAEHPSSYPIQTIVDDISVYDAQHSAFSDIESIFSVGSTCFTLCNPDYGAQATILEYVQPTNGRVKISLNRTTEPDFTEIIKMEEDIFNRYYTLYMCATRLAMSNYVFSRITGAIFIITPNNEGGLKNVNIGLDLKFNKKNLETPGYTKKVNGTWYYSDKAIDVVGQYVEKFPEVFRFLTKNSNQDDLNAEEVFSYDSDEKVKELQKWLRTLPCNSVEKKVCGSAVCEPEIVAEIEKIVDNFPKVKGQQIRMQIKPNLLFKPEMSSGNVMPDSNAEILLFDRVVNVREGFTVPLGLKGTVIAIHNSPLDNNQIYDVVFDSEFTGGMTLNCTPNRGYRLPKTAIICISHGIRLLQKLGRPGELLQKARAAEENKNKGDMDYQQRGPKMNTRPQNSAFASYQNERYQNRNSKNPSQASMLNNSQRQGPPPRQPFQNQPQSTENNVNDFIAKFANIPPQIMRAKPPVEPPSTDVKSFMNQFVNKSAPQHQKVESPLKKGCDFMPTFEQGPKPAEQKVDTDFLKKMLGIASTSAGKSNEKVAENAKKIAAKSETVVEKEIPTIFILPKQEPPKPKKKVNYLVQLLDYYQANNMGLPRYQYFETGSETQSQITLPNRQVIIGNPGKTREEASENVARNALAVLQKTPATKQSPKKLPPVPKNWVQQAQQHNVKPQNNKEGDLFEKENKKKSPKTPKSNSNNGDNSATKTLSNSFVPLQAVKQHINKNKAKESYSEAAGGKSDESKNETQEQRSNSKTQQSTSKTQKPKKPRQMRIAANFNMK